MSNASRLDIFNKKLLSGTGGMFLTNDCLYKEGINRFQCDIRTLDEVTDAKPFLKGTTCILALGTQALERLGDTKTELNAQRGSPLFTDDGIPIIASYLPQEAVDRKNFELEFNPLVAAQAALDSDEASNNALAEKRRHGKTNQKNFKFWLKKDVEKAVRIINSPTLATETSHEATYNIYPNSPDIIHNLRSVKNSCLYFDIETDAALNITCFSFAFSLSEVFVVPVITHQYSHAYPDLPNIFSALARAIKENTLVCHNGAGFDYLVLGHKYKIPTYKVYDTMVSQNRVYPGVEKSLGHCISLPWMMEPYHKDEGNFSHGNREQAMQLWRYCGKDVSSLIHLKTAQDEYARKHIGIRESIDAVNSYIPSYNLLTLQGIRYDKSKIEAIWKENDRQCMFILKCLKILIGEGFLKKIRGSGKSPMPNSNNQCCRYFHELLRYPVVGRTAANKPKLDKKAMFKLKLKFTNSVIDLVIKYRQLLKESGSLKFLPFKE